MTWKSHIAIATAVTLPFNPTAIPFAILGSTAPDWSEWILKFFGITVQHRGATHYLYVPLTIMFIGLASYDYLYWFGVGYFTHWFADSMTKSGVPLSQFDNHKIHFFGGKIRTGEPIEYVIAFGLLLFSVLVVQPSMGMIKGDEESKFNAYYMDYRDLNEKGIIDNKTYKENRFKLF